MCFCVVSTFFSLKDSSAAAESDDGMRFLLLSRVILGKSEIVPRGSTQSCPSSQEFDSGVDDLASPSKYIVWSTHMNTHVLPEFLVCIKAPLNFNRKQKPNLIKRSCFLCSLDSCFVDIIIFFCRKCKEIEITMDGISCIDQSIVKVSASFPNIYHSETLQRSTSKCFVSSFILLFR